MLIFNTTYKVSSSITVSWIEWVRHVHIPFMMADEKFSSPQIAKIVGSEDAQGVSFSVQFHIADMDALIAWHKENATKFQHNFQQQFGQDVQFFSTVLELVE